MPSDATYGIDVESHVEPFRGSDPIKREPQSDKCEQEGGGSSRPGGQTGNPVDCGTKKLSVSQVEEYLKFIKK